MGVSRPLPPRRTLAARPRRRFIVALRRQPLLFWAFALVAAASTYLVVHSALSTTVEGAAAYGDLVSVPVAQRDLASGELIAEGDISITLLPNDLVPDGAVDLSPVGQSVRHPIVAGEAVVTQRLAPHGAVGVAAMLGPDQRAVTIPVPPQGTPVAVGQLVDVLATVDPESARGRNPTSVVAPGATVVAISDGGLTVATSVDDAARIATALSYAVISVAIAG